MASVGRWIPGHVLRFGVACSVVGPGRLHGGKLDAKNRKFLEKLSGLAREGRRPLSEFLRLSGQASEDDLKAVRAFLFELYRGYTNLPIAESGKRKSKAIKPKALT